jgi:hypothetical protein
MKPDVIFKFCTMISLVLSFGCSALETGTKKSPAKGTDNPAVGMASPPAIIYKTKTDYFDKVPVILSDDKTRIVSFPDPRDLRINGEFAYPSKLMDGYLLDNRGIGPNAAFLRFSYEEYCTMDNIPTAERLFNYISEKNPFTEMYQCGNRGNYDEIVAELNLIILAGKIKDCKNLLK